jgi:hypothetical protein
VPPLFCYHWGSIFDEEGILNYCLMVHCTKGQVGNVAKNGKVGPGTATLECCDCRSFYAIVVQTGGWSWREDTTSRANFRVSRSFLLVLKGDRAEILRLF